MRARINDSEIEYEEYGSGPAVLFLHDYASNRELPEAQTTGLVKAGYRVISTHLRGIGKGEAEDFEPSSHTRDAIALFNYLGIGRAVVFGISRGGLVLLDLLERYPDRVAAASMVLSPEAVRDVRRLAKCSLIRKALREGKLDQLKRTLLAALAKKPGDVRALAALQPLRNWIQLLSSRKGQKHSEGRSELLAGLAIPPMLMTEEGAEPVPAVKSSMRSRGWQKIKGINSHLAAFLDSLLPHDEDEDEEEIFTGQA
ncbi:MAG: alpha/beta hydrolase [Desulfuromonadales bacterium]